MKKLLVLLLTAVLLGCVTLAAAEAVDVTRSWYLDTVNVPGASLRARDLGLAMTLTLNEDGTVSLSGNALEQSAHGVWSLADGELSVSFEGALVDESPIALAEGRLVMADGNTEMIFVRETDMIVETEEKIVPVTDAAVLDGVWHIKEINAFGMVIYPEAMDPADLQQLLGAVDMRVVLEGGKASLMGSEMTSMTLDDGALVVEDGVDGSLMRIDLLADGRLRLDIMDVVFFCEKERLDAADAERVTGTWYLNAVEAYGTTVSVADVGVGMTMTLNADGTAVNAMVGMEAVEEGTWTFNGSEGTVSLVNASYAFTLTGDALVLVPGEDQRMIFTRASASGSLALDEGVSQGTIFVRDPSAPANAPIEVTVIKTSPVVAIEDASVVDGAWAMTLTSLLDVQELPDGHRIEELFCMDGCMVLVDGKVSLDGDMVPMTLTDGVLTLADDRDGVQLTIKLLADGKLRVSYLGVEFESGRGK